MKSKADSSSNIYNLCIYKKGLFFPILFSYFFFYVSLLFIQLVMLSFLFNSINCNHISSSSLMSNSVYYTHSLEKKNFFQFFENTNFAKLFHLSVQILIHICCCLTKSLTNNCCMHKNLTCIIEKNIYVRF